MRRGKLNQKAILYIIFAAVFTLLSYFLDQQVIQKEDTTRKQEAETERDRGLQVLLTDYLWDRIPS